MATEDYKLARVYCEAVKTSVRRSRSAWESKGKEPTPCAAEGEHTGVVPPRRHHKAVTRPGRAAVPSPPECP